MASYRSDPTANATIGNVDKEIRKMQKEVRKLAELRRRRGLTPSEEALARKKFTGIYRSLLAEAIGS